MKGIGDYDRASRYFTHVDIRSGSKTFWRQVDNRYVGVSTHGGQDQFKEGADMKIEPIKVKSLDTGAVIEVSAIVEGAEHYFKTKDLELLLPVKIGWDANTKTVTFNLIYK